MNRRALTALVGGISGVVVAHAVAYLGPLQGHDSAGAHPHHHVHATNGYWHHAAALALVCGLAAIAMAVHAGWRQRSEPDARAPFPRRLALLTGWQLALYLTMEAAERLSSGVEFTSLTSDRSFFAGVVLQVVVAAIVLLLLGGVERVAATLARRQRELLIRPQRPLIRVFSEQIPRRGSLTSSAPRAPPGY